MLPKSTIETVNIINIASNVPIWSSSVTAFLCCVLAIWTQTYFAFYIHVPGDRGSTVVKAAVSIPDDVTGIFHWHNPSGRTMALGSTQPLTEMSTRSFTGGKGGQCVRLTTYHHPVPLSRNLGTLTSWNPLGLSRPVIGLIYLYLLRSLLHVYQ